MFVHAGPGSSRLPGAGWELCCGTSRQHLVLLSSPVTGSSHALAGRGGWDCTPGVEILGHCVPGPVGGEKELAVRTAKAGSSTSQPPHLGKVSRFAAVSLPQRLWVQRKGEWAVVLSCSQRLSRLLVSSSGLLPESCFSIMLETWWWLSTVMMVDAEEGREHPKAGLCTLQPPQCPSPGCVPELPACSEGNWAQREASCPPSSLSSPGRCRYACSQRLSAGPSPALPHLPLL